MRSMEWQKRGRGALGDARQKLIHIRAPIMHYPEPCYSHDDDDDDDDDNDDDDDDDGWHWW